MNATVDPKREQMALAPGGRCTAEGGDRDVDRRCPDAPDHVAVRVERQARPDACSTDVKGGGLGGGVPLSTHLSKAVNAAWTTLCWGPLFTGVVQPRTLDAAPTK